MKKILTIIAVLSFVTMSFSQVISGRIEEKPGTISGRIEEKPGTISGRVEEKPGTISGRVEEKPGTISGRVEEKPGTISGRVEEKPGTISGRVNTSRISDDIIGQIFKLSVNRNTVNIVSYNCGLIEKFFPNCRVYFDTKFEQYGYSGEFHRIKTYIFTDEDLLLIYDYFSRMYPNCYFQFNNTPVSTISNGNPSNDDYWEWFYDDLVLPITGRIR